MSSNTRTNSEMSDDPCWIEVMVRQAGAYGHGADATARLVAWIVTSYSPCCERSSR